MSKIETTYHSILPDSQDFPEFPIKMGLHRRGYFEYDEHTVGFTNPYASLIGSSKSGYVVLPAVEIDGKSIYEMELMELLYSLVDEESTSSFKKEANYTDYDPYCLFNTVPIYYKSLTIDDCIEWEPDEVIQLWFEYHLFSKLWLPIGLLGLPTNEIIEQTEELNRLYQCRHTSKD